MFDINNLIIEQINTKIKKEKSFIIKTKLLIDLIDFENTFPDIKSDINDKWYRNTGERYLQSNYYISADDRDFLLEYAEKAKDLEKIKDLINKLCSLSDGVYDYDTIIADATNEISIIADISKFDFSSDNTKELEKTQKKTSVNVLLKRKMQ